MTEQTQPTDAEISACILAAKVKCVHPEAVTTIEIARAVLAKWGTPAGAGEPEGWITWFRTPNGSREPIYSHGPKKPSHGAELDALLRKYPLFTTPQPTQAQAGAGRPTDEQCKDFWANGMDQLHDWLIAQSGPLVGVSFSSEEAEKLTKAAHVVSQKCYTPHDIFVKRLFTENAQKGADHG